MITTFKLTKTIKLQRYNSGGLKIFLVYRKKWIIIKLSSYQVKLLQWILNLFLSKTKEVKINV